MPQRKVTDKKTLKEKTACQIEVFDTEGKVSGKLNLPEKIFAAKVNKDLIAQAVRVYLANQRQGTQNTKTRSEVRFSTAKIYRQKGTGRARHGARSAPIFVGGGIAHGPKPRDFSLSLPKKMRRAALFAALSAKLAEKNIIAIEGLEKVEAKTKAFTKILENLKNVLGNKELKKKALKILIVLPGKLENLERAARNVWGISLSEARLLNTYSVLNHQKLLFLKDSIPVLEKNFLERKSEKAEEKEATKKTAK